jgi:hypothetical protein
MSTPRVTDWGKLIGPNPTHSMQLNTEANAPAPRSVCEGIGLRTAANNQLEHIIVWTSIGLTIAVSQTQFSHALLFSNYYAVFVSSVWIVLNLPDILFLQFQLPLAAGEWGRRLVAGVGHVEHEMLSILNCAMFEDGGMSYRTGHGPLSPGAAIPTLFLPTVTLGFRPFG